MKKRLLALVMGACMMFTLAGCGNEAADNADKEVEAAIKTDTITIQKYIGLEVSVENNLEVTDEEVEASIQSTLSMFAAENTEDVAENGDLVIIDYEGKIDGVAFAGGTATEQSVTIGAGGYIPGFEEGIVGHKVGETFDVPVTFPEEYHAPDLAGKEAVFTMTLKGITPELTDELVQKISITSKTVEEYKEEQRAALELSNKETYAYQLQGAVWEELVKQCSMEEYPQDMIDKQHATLESMFGDLVETYSLDELVKMVYGVDIDTYVQDVIKQAFAADAIAEAEGIEITDEEYEAYLLECANSYGYEDPTEFETAVGEEAVLRNLINNKVGEFLVDNCIQK